MKKITSLFVAMLLLLSSCGSVPLTGRKQVLLVSDQEVLSSSLTQYSDYMKSAKKSSSKDGAAMVTRVGKKIAAATEQYLRNNGLESEIKNFAWEFNLVNDPQVNAFCMPGGVKSLSMKDGCSWFRRTMNWPSWSVMKWRMP